MLDFNNTQIAFSSKSNGELRNAHLLFNTIAHPWLVKCAKVASNFALKIHFPISWAVKPTLYKQFVGGETLQDCLPVIEHLKQYNVKSTLDFSAESEQTPEGIQATFEETLRSIDFARGNDNLAYTVFKPSTITTDELLAKASEKREPLTEAEKAEYEEFKKRFFALCQRCLICFFCKCFYAKCFEKRDNTVVVTVAAADLNNAENIKVLAFADKEKLKKSVKRCKNACDSLYEAVEVAVLNLPVNISCLE